MLSLEDWAEIRRLHRAEGLPIKMIARTLGISRNTVRGALAAEGPPKYVRTPTGVLIHRDTAHAPEVAASQGVRSLDLLRAGIVDRIVPEPIDAADAPVEFLRVWGGWCSTNWLPS